MGRFKRYANPINPFDRQTILPRSVRDTFKRFRTDQDGVDTNEQQVSKVFKPILTNVNAVSIPA